MPDTPTPREERVSDEEVERLLGSSPGLWTGHQTVLAVMALEDLHAARSRVSGLEAEVEAADERFHWINAQLADAGYPVLDLPADTLVHLIEDRDALREQLAEAQEAIFCATHHGGDIDECEALRVRGREIRREWGQARCSEFAEKCGEDERQPRPSTPEFEEALNGFAEAINNGCVHALQQTPPSGEISTGHTDQIAEVRAEVVRLFDAERERGRELEDLMYKLKELRNGSPNALYEMFDSAFRRLGLAEGYEAWLENHQAVVEQADRERRAGESDG